MVTLLLAAALLAPLPLQPEYCQLVLTGGQTEPLALALDDPARLAPLPEGSTAIACPRASIVPIGNDLRVLTELGVAFGIIEEGPRSLWLYAADGRLQVQIDSGELSPPEAAAVSDWLARAQGRFDEAPASR